jgi:hypothetical protein
MVTNFYDSMNDVTYVFRKPESEGTIPVTEHLPETDREPGAEDNIFCRSCGQAITKASERIQMSGSHRHTFTNPHGFTFEIGCFRTADGCVCVGPATAEHTWFAGFMWRIAVCASCRIHMGWRFTAADPAAAFNGLILNRLAEAANGRRGAKPR